MNKNNIKNQYKQNKKENKDKNPRDGFVKIAELTGFYLSFDKSGNLIKQ